MLATEKFLVTFEFKIQSNSSYKNPKIINIFTLNSCRAHFYKHTESSKPQIKSLTVHLEKSVDAHTVNLNEYYRLKFWNPEPSVYFQT